MGVGGADGCAGAGAAEPQGAGQQPQGRKGNARTAAAGGGRNTGLRQYESDFNGTVLLFDGII